MKNLRVIPFLSLLALTLGILNIGQSQTILKSKNSVILNLTGTSTMHDWEMKSSTGDCSATFVFDANSNIKDISAMNFTVSAKSLKSGKDAMDKNAYKALKSDKNPNITASLKSTKITTTDNKTYTVKSMIKLTIAGVSKETELVATVKRINDNSFSVKGEKNISMKDFQIDPPSFMLGAVKTGNDVVLNFDIVLNQ
jgi:polyisoprenoid-binding protein YceI